ncbi:MAG TPA: hypothetical protein VFP84_36975 [Kofleriaceae bacterium]|nr:hypothetical protein [Kofleriaceae bacterium]
MITGAIPVASALAEGGAFGVEATIGAIMGAVGAIGVVVFAWQAAHRRVPSTQGTDDGGGSRRR